MLQTMAGGDLAASSPPPMPSSLPPQLRAHASLSCGPGGAFTASVLCLQRTAHGPATHTHKHKYTLVYSQTHCGNGRLMGAHRRASRVFEIINDRMRAGAALNYDRETLIIIVECTRGASVCVYLCASTCVCVRARPRQAERMCNVCGCMSGRAGAQRLYILQ